MTQKTNAARFLDQTGIRYELREYEVDPEDLAAETLLPRSACRPRKFSKHCWPREINGRLGGRTMSNTTSSDEAMAVVRRNTEEVQGKGNFEVFDELFADDFVDHTTQPGTTPDKAGVRKLYTYMRVAFPDFHAEIHWQLADGDRVTTYKTYHGTHEGPFLGVAPTHRRIHFESVDVMRVQNGKITDHWGVGNLLSLMQQIGGWTPPSEI